MPKLTMEIHLCEEDRRRIDLVVELLQSMEGLTIEDGEKSTRKAGSAKKGKTGKKASPPPDEDIDGLNDDGDDEVTREDVRAALKQYLKIEGKEAAIEILNEVGGAKSMGELEQDKFQAVIDACGTD